MSQMLTRSRVRCCTQLRLSSIALALLASACAPGSIFRVAPAGSQTKTILVDAQQRAINIDNQVAFRTRICSEKSPDAILALAASGKLTVTMPNGAGGSFDASQSETISSLAFRNGITETQQVLLYYYCQLNVNGTLSDADVATDLRRFQNTLLAMMAVDGLTQAARKAAAAAAPPGAGQADGAPGQSDAAGDQAGKLAAAQKEVDAKSAAVKESEGKVKGATEKLAEAMKGADKAAQDAAQGALDEEKKKATKAEGELKLAQDNLKKLQAASTRAAAGGSTQDDASVGMAAVADAVATIVQTVVYQTFTTEMCLKALFDPPGISSQISPLEPVTDPALAVSAKYQQRAPAETKKSLEPSGALFAFCLEHLRDVDRFRFEDNQLNHGVVKEDSKFVKSPGGAPGTMEPDRREPLGPLRPSRVLLQPLVR